MLPPPDIMMILQMKHRMILPHAKHICVFPGGTDVTVDSTVVIVVGGFVGCVVFANVLQQIRLPGHNPYRGFITPSPEMVTIPLGSHSDIFTQMQFGNTVGVDDVDDTVVGITVDRVVIVDCVVIVGQGVTVIYGG